MEQNILCATLNEAVPIVRSQQNFGMKNWFEIKQKTKKGQYVLCATLKKVKLLLLSDGG